MPTTCTIELRPHSRKLTVDAGKSLIKSLVDHSIFLRSDCGGRGTCGKCQVELVHQTGTREKVNACSLIVESDLTVEIQSASLLSSHVITKAPATFPASFTARLAHHGGKSGRYGIGVDIGTTTIAVYLCNIISGEVRGSIAVKNPQALYGDDVMSRIHAINMGRESLDHLRQIVINGIEWGIAALTEQNGVQRQQLERMVAVGNPTMIHILCGVDPAPIGVAPYQPAFHESRTMRSGELGFGSIDLPVTTLPQISGFLGGDILAAALAVDLASQPDGTLLIDLGTNGELLLKRDHLLFATSCATGPAFEGASLSCGMQAIPGAVNKISISTPDGLPAYTVIPANGNRSATPSGVCGTGVISGVAELWRHRILESGGAFCKDRQLCALTTDEEKRLKFMLVPRELSQDGRSIHISQKDVRSVQLGKGALSTGIDFLLESAGLRKPEKIIIAGAFGSYIEVEDMFTLGMIPRIDRSRVEVAGNSAGAGAIMVLCDDYYLAAAQQMAARVQTVELAGDIRFQEAFIANLGFVDSESDKI